MTHLSPAEYVIRIFGGVRKTARAIGVSPTAVVGWRAIGRRKEQLGRVPSKSQRRILERARELGLDLTAEDLIMGREVLIEAAS